MMGIEEAVKAFDDRYPSFKGLCSHACHDFVGYNCACPPARAIARIFGVYPENLCQTLIAIDRIGRK